VPKADYAIYFSALDLGGRIWKRVALLDGCQCVESMGSNMEAERALKFQACLPSGLSTVEVVARGCNESDLTKVLSVERHYVVGGVNIYDRSGGSAWQGGPKGLTAGWKII